MRSNPPKSVVLHYEFRGLHGLIANLTGQPSFIDCPKDNFTLIDYWKFSRGKEKVETSRGEYALTSEKISSILLRHQAHTTKVVRLDYVLGKTN